MFRSIRQLAVLFFSASCLLTLSVDLATAQSGAETASADVLPSAETPPPEPVPAPPPTKPEIIPDVDADGSILAYDLGVSILPDGTQVRGVVIGSPAQLAGIKPGDTIVSVNGEDVKDGTAVAQRLLQAGSTSFTIGVSRRSEFLSLQVDMSAAVSSSGAPSPGIEQAAASGGYAAIPPRRANIYRYAPRELRGNYGYGRAPGYYGYRAGPRVSVRVGTGYGPLYGPSFYSRGYRSYYGPGFRYGGYGLGYRGYGRGGVSVRIGGIGIGF